MQDRNMPQHVQEWLEEIEQNPMADTDRVSQLCDRLDQYADENNDTSLKGQSLFYRGFNKYANAHLEEGMEILSTSVNLLISAKQWRLAGNAYNSMANIADFQGDVSTAIEYYLKGLYIATENNIVKLEYTIRTGIANIYIGLGAYEKAVAMLMECEQLQESNKDMPEESVQISAANMVGCYILLGETEKASQKLEALREMYGEHPSDSNALLLCILETQFHHLTGNSEALEASIAALDSMTLSDIDVFGTFYELILHAQLLLDLGKMKELDQLLTRLEDLADTPVVEQKILDLRMMYYHKIGDHDRLAEQALRFHEVSRLCEQERNKIVTHNVAIHMHLDQETRKRQEIEKTNLLLKEKSEHDALTGLNNRYKLNELAESAFHKAQQNKLPLAIEILDIDCYKEYNDNYGHQAGDECLIRIADAIRSLEEYEGVHTARYGGDEFVIIYEGYSAEEVERMVKLLHDKIYDLNAEHKFSAVSDRVSISQGVFHKVPAGINKLWDFLYAADTILYSVKHRGKNNYHLETSFEGVARYSAES